MGATDRHGDPLRYDGYSRFCAQNSETFPRPTNRLRDHPTPIQRHVAYRLTYHWTARITNTHTHKYTRSITLNYSLDTIDGRRVRRTTVVLVERTLCSDHKDATAMGTARAFGQGRISKLVRRTAVGSLVNNRQVSRERNRSRLHDEPRPRYLRQLLLSRRVSHHGPLCPLSLLTTQVGLRLPLCKVALLLLLERQWRITQSLCLNGGRRWASRGWL